MVIKDEKIAGLNKTLDLRQKEIDKLCDTLAQQKEEIARLAKCS